MHLFGLLRRVSAWLGAAVSIFALSWCPAAAGDNEHHAPLPPTLVQPVDWSLYTSRVPQPQPAASTRRLRNRHPQTKRHAEAWTTFHYDNLRTAWNPNETLLTTANVNASNFGMLYSEPVDGEVYAEPLYVPNVRVRKLGIHDLLLIATEGDSIYAFDAESGAQLYKTTYVSPPSVTTFDPYICQCSNIAFQQGITGTPVIDIKSSLMYFVAKTVETQGSISTTHYRLHALDIRTGIDAMPNTDINASIIAEDGTQVYLDQIWSIQRPGLALSNNVVYVAFGSGADYHPVNTSGWLVAFDKTNLQQIAQFSDETGDAQVQNIWYDGAVSTRLGAFWGSGAAPAVDKQGNLYVESGNGAFDGQLDFAMTAIKVSPDLSHVVDYFTPSTWYNDSNADQDLGSSGVILLPKQPGGVKNIAIAGGKTGISFVLNQHNMGKFNVSGNQILSQTTTNDGLWGTTAAYTGSDGASYLLVPGGGPMTLWRVQNGSSVSLGYLSQTVDHFSDYGDAGSEPVVSSNGAAPGSAIVWAYSRVGSGGPAQLTLRAYDATNLANKLIELPFTNWEGGGELLTPTVANGMVFTAGEGNVSAYGIL
jgi:hypothetical protein